jgi:hypothetical protein
LPIDDLKDTILKHQKSDPQGLHLSSGVFRIVCFGLITAKTLGQYLEGII